MQTADGAAADFIGHVWFVANALSDLERATADPVQLSIESTLAWQQLDDAIRERWKAVGELAVRRFEETPVELRRRWARTGTSLPNAVLLQQLAAQVRAELPSAADTGDPVAAFLLVSDHDRLAQLLAINETRAARFRPRRNAPRSEAFDVDLRALIVDWLQGQELAEIGETYLAAVTDETYRYEQLSEFIVPGARAPASLAPQHAGRVGERRPGRGRPPLSRASGLRPVRCRHAHRARAGQGRCSVSAPRARRRRCRRGRDGAASFASGWRRLTSGPGADSSTPARASSPICSCSARARDARITSRVLAGEVVEVPLVIEGSPSPGAVEVRESTRIRRRGWPRSATARSSGTSAPVTMTT